ncbi:MAG: MoxR family ATPase [Eubacterium sp.]|nr:MoxR family ATPase [Eubacterium sp.]
MNMTIQTCAQALMKETEKIFVGKKDKIELILMAIFSGGHVLLDDLPGSGKTTLIKTISKALGCGFERIQFTPDLLPADVTGMTIFDQKANDFRLVKGPVFTNILLADEINRAIPRTQAALLEAMEEKQVTIDGQTLALPKPFFVMATQNPVEMESTFTLPAAQMDRFFIRLSLEYPDVTEEMEILESLGMGTDYEKIEAVASPAVLVSLKEELEDVHISEALRAYIVKLVHGTRNHPDIKIGASPRASRSLYQGAKSYAAMQGRDYATPEDVQHIFQGVLSHRIQLRNEARYGKKSVTDVLNEILKQTKVEAEVEELFDEK